MRQWRAGFKRGGAVGFTAINDRAGADCLDGSARSWTVPGGFYQP